MQQARQLDSTPAVILEAIHCGPWLPEQIEAVESKYVLEGNPARVGRGFLLDLNQTVANKEDTGEPVIGPGLPPTVRDRSKLVTSDCIQMP